MSIVKHRAGAWCRTADGDVEYYYRTSRLGPEDAVRTFRGSLSDTTTIVSEIVVDELRYDDN
jgi:hypothetical protein